MSGPLVVLGLLSGTSVDAIDVAAAEFALDGSGTLTMRPLGHREQLWPPWLRARVLAVFPPAVTTIGEVCALDNELGQAFAAAAVAGLPDVRPDLVASLGQTVFHDVRAGRCHGTLQLGQPAWIAEATGLPVVSDLRPADIAAGGHGAPLASTLDALWLAPGAAALNRGGIANVTVLPPEPLGAEVLAPEATAVLAFDTGPANCLLDLAAARLLGAACDLGGAVAAAGAVRADLLAALLDHPYFAAPPPKSCGRELFDAPYLDHALTRVAPVRTADLLATLTEFTAATVADALDRFPVREVVGSGGGVRNPVLLAALRRRLSPRPVLTSDERGLPADGKEAYLVALLGALTWYGLPGTVPGATGARRTTVLGRLTPPRTPTAAAPTTLRIVT